MSIEYANDFRFWEDDIADTTMPELPPEEIEYIVDIANDPIDGAKALQAYADGQSPEMAAHILRKAADRLNYIHMAQFLNRITQVSVENEFDTQNPAQLEDMLELLIELRNKGNARVGGKMGFFEKHDFIDKTGATRPTLALRMHSGAFFGHSEEGGKVVEIPNFVTIPITAITDYQIAERDAA